MLGEGRRQCARPSGHRPTGDDGRDGDSMGALGGAEVARYCRPFSRTAGGRLPIRHGRQRRARERGGDSQMRGIGAPPHARGQAADSGGYLAPTGHGEDAPADFRSGMARFLRGGDRSPDCGQRERGGRYFDAGGHGILLAEGNGAVSDHLQGCGDFCGDSSQRRHFQSPGSAYDGLSGLRAPRHARLLAPLGGSVEAGVARQTPVSGGSGFCGRAHRAASEQGICRRAS